MAGAMEHWRSASLRGRTLSGVLCSWQHVLALLLIRGVCSQTALGNAIQKDHTEIATACADGKSGAGTMLCGL